MWPVVWWSSSSEGEITLNLFYGQFCFLNLVNTGNLFVDQTHCLTLEGVVLPHQIPVSLRGSLPASRYPQPWGRRGRGCAAAVRRSEAVADASYLQPPDLPQCLGSARWVSFCTDPNDSWNYHSLKISVCSLMLMIYRWVRSFWPVLSGSEENFS